MLEGQHECFTIVAVILIELISKRRFLLMSELNIISKLLLHRIDQHAKVSEQI